MKINYKIQMDKEIENIKNSGKRPSLLLHACCAPCSSAVLETLRTVFDITLFFYNPNIYPEKEFVFRLDELNRLVREMNMEGVSIIAPDYDNMEFENAIKGFESIAEGGIRCEKCYRLRLDKSVSYAKINGFDYITTTLSISPYKNAQWLNNIGLELSGKYGVKYLVSDFKKGNGYRRSCELSNEYGLYRQDYCGCVYSKREKNKMEIKIFKGLPAESKQIREEVFVCEQGFTEEYDEFDDIATHILLFDGNKAVATCRIYEKKAGQYMFGRLAVKKQLRKSGLGRKIVTAAENFVKENGGNSIILHSQLQAKGFYQKLGFSEYGEIEEEQGCPHIWMKKIF